MSEVTRTALITGASAGIGEEFARQLAAAGWNLALCARRMERLESLAETLITAHGIRAEAFACDLNDADAPTRLLHELQQRGLVIDMLVNNAGFGLPGNFVAHDWDTHRQFLQLMLSAPTELAHRLLPAMRQRNFGRIINVSSLAGLVPGTAGHTLYSAVKSYLIKFSQSLALENRDRDIHVCALCPGFTYSEFHDANGTRPMVSKMPKFMWMNAATVVRQGIAAVESGKIVYVTGRFNRFVHSLVKLLPDKLALKLVDRRSKTFRHRD